MTKAVLRTAAERPDLVAVAGGGDQLTYSELAETSRRTIAAVVRLCMPHRRIRPLLLPRPAAFP